MSYRNAPKYKNTDVSASTVQNLLQTINSMSQRCRGQANTEDILQRVRSIILMYRPHLSNRIDLQLPELTMEALMPNSTNANQITHNFNYKYDYNTNIPPNAYNPFLQPPQQPSPSSQQQQQQQQPPLQSFTFNAVPPPTGGTGAAPVQAESTASPQTVVVTAPLSIEQNDLTSLNVLHVNAQRTPGVASYKQLLRYIVYLVRKYVRYEQITISLELLENFDTIQTNNDIAELLQCIERETNWVLPNGPSVCRWISILITSYCRIVARVTKRDLVLSSIRTEERLLAVIAEVETAVVDIVNATPPPAPPTPTITPEIEAINKQRIELLNSTVQQQQLDITQMQTRYTSLQQQYDTFQSKTLVLNTAFDKLRNYYRTNVTSPAPENEQDLVSSLIRYFDELQSTQTTVSQQSQAQSAALTEQSQAYQRLQQQLVQTQTQYNETVAELRRSIDEKDSYLAATALKLSSFEDGQSQLRAVQAKNEELQAQIATLDDNYRRMVERNKSLEESYNRLQDESKKRRSSVAVKPIRKVKAVRRGVDAQNAKLIEETQKLIQQHKLKNQQLQEMKTRYNETIDSNVKMLEVIKNDALKTRSQVESLINNQAALSALDFKALNTKSTQNLADEVSLLRAENVAVREMCDQQLGVESALLQERLQDSKVNLVSKIDKLIEQVAPLQDRIEQSATEIEEFKTRIELMGRKEAIRPTK
ncbi:DESMOP [Spodoptera cosmioides nucleopolyhedrovirus]|uniref:DESMOP n=1 Tax=Spodoptera cosmioides nucleopolyhedrovirus TaxID=2605774 RepID=A0A6B7KHA3_9ABAC|nr:DESMOP [Spodoptera cosmioides nucleopolyhedrovirus]